MSISCSHTAWEELAELGIGIAHAKKSCDTDIYCYFHVLLIKTNLVIYICY